MRKHRSYPIEFKRQVAQECLTGETLHELAKRHEINRNLVRIWVAKYEASFDSDVAAADIVRIQETRIAALERLVGKLVLENELLKAAVRRRRPGGLSVAEGCRLMGLSRSTYYDEPSGQPIEEARLVERIRGSAPSGPATAIGE